MNKESEEATKTKVSVIVPVYNGEKHLRQCLDSICNQTLREIEILCVDDGSTDSSPAILEEYRANDNRFQIFRQENRYAGAARNLGMRHATGEYLAFWDCDDFFEPEALEELYDRATEFQADVVVCGANKYYDNLDQFQRMYLGALNVKRLPKGPVFSRKNFENGILNFTNVAAWNKLFRRAFIEKINLEFQEIRNGNDVFFTLVSIAMAERVTTVNQPLVNYRTNRSDSLVSTSWLSPHTVNEAWASAAEYLTARNAFPEESYVRRAVESLVYNLRNIQEYNAFIQTVQNLQNDLLERMHITAGRPPEFYNAAWHAEFIDRLMTDSPEQLLIWLSHFNYLKLQEQSMKQQNTREKLNEAKAVLKTTKSELTDSRKNAKSLEKELKSEQKQHEKVQKQLEEIRGSHSYRIGRMITRPVRAIRRRK